MGELHPEVLQLIKDVHGHMGQQAEHNKQTLIWREQLDTTIKAMPTACVTGQLHGQRLNALEKKKASCNGDSKKMSGKKKAAIGSVSLTGIAAVIVAIFKIWQGIE